MRKFYSLCLLLCPAGLIQASIVYGTIADQPPAAAVDFPTLESANNASNYALEISLLNFQQTGGDPDTNSTPVRFQSKQGLADGISYTWTAPQEAGAIRASVPEGVEKKVAPLPDPKAEPKTLGIAGFVLIGVGWIRRPARGSGRV